MTFGRPPWSPFAAVTWSSRVFSGSQNAQVLMGVLRASDLWKRDHLGAFSNSRVWSFMRTAARRRLDLAEPSAGVFGEGFRVPDSGLLTDERRSSRRTSAAQQTNRTAAVGGSGLTDTGALSISVIRGAEFAGPNA
jgi:hypothetical protein